MDFTPTRRQVAWSDRSFGRQVGESRDHDRVAGPNVPKEPGKIARDGAKHDPGHAFDTPGVGNVGFVVCDETDEVASLDAEGFGDAPKRIGDRFVDAGRGQVDETRKQLGKQPLERQELADWRGVRRGHGTGRIDHRG